MSVERILSPSSEDTAMAPTPPQNPKGGSKPKRASPGDVELSVFDIHNIFRRRWFPSRDHLLTNVISAQKAEDGNISWVEFTPQYHSHLVKCAVPLVPHPVAKVKKVMFVYILELLNREGHVAFFELQKGGRKASTAQKEKRRLARKRSRAAKRERDQEAAKVAKQPPREQQCVACGRKFNSRKTASKHKCPKSKVERVGREAASGQASQATSAAKPDKPPATLTPHAPTAPPNINSPPAVTGDSQDSSQRHIIIFSVRTGLRRRILREEWPGMWETGLWRLG
jgi:predicted RNA-binding Zn-ribbon protein involved in translation (DUF1610 family)